MELQQLPFEADLISKISSECQIASVKKDTLLAESGKYMKVIPIVLEGYIRVFKNDYERNREILVYYIAPGETCMMSIIAGFSDKKSQVHAMTEKDTKLVLVPTPKVREWQVQYPKWNNFILQIFLNRYTELLNTINDLSFKNIDERLYNYLVQCHHRHGHMRLELTHQQLANELGTTRVVVSRLLKEFENKGMVRLLRGQIQLEHLNHVRN